MLSLSFFKKKSVYDVVNNAKIRYEAPTELSSVVERDNR